MKQKFKALARILFFCKSRTKTWRGLFNNLLSDTNHKIRKLAPTNRTWLVLAGRTKTSREESTTCNSKWKDWSRSSMSWVKRIKLSDAKPNKVKFRLHKSINRKRPNKSTFTSSKSCRLRLNGKDRSKNWQEDWMIWVGMRKENWPGMKNKWKDLLLRLKSSTWK